MPGAQGYSRILLGPLFTKPWYVLVQNLAKSRSLEIFVSSYPIALQFDGRLGSTAAEPPLKVQNDTIIIAPNLAVARYHEI